MSVVAWLLLVVAVAAIAAIAWRAASKRRSAEETKAAVETRVEREPVPMAPDAGAAAAAPEEPAAPVAAGLPRPAEPAPESPGSGTPASTTLEAAPPAMPPTVVVAPPVAAPPSIAVPVETAPRPAPLPLAVVDDERWVSAQPIDVPLDTLGAVSIVADGRSAEGVFALLLVGNEMLEIAKADSRTLDRLAQRPVPSIGGDPRSATPAIDREAAVALAGAALAVRVRERHGAELEAQLAELKSALPGIVSRLDAESQARAKALVHDLSRFVRESREHYAAVVRKPVFHERIAEAAAEATNLWQALQARARGPRTQIEGGVAASRFGEVQLERAVAQLRSLHDERRTAAFGARLVAAFSLARLAFGADRAPAGVAPVEELAAARRADVEAELALLARLEACERSAKAPAYAGKGEFEKNRAASRESIAKLRESAEGATRILETARERLAAGFLGGEAVDASLLWRCDARGRVVEVRCASAAAPRPAASAAPQLAAASG